MKYWNPLEPNTLRYPKPSGVESFQVADDFDVEVAKVVDVAGNRSAGVDTVKQAQKQAAIAAEKSAKELREQNKASAYASIDAIKNFDDVKEILKYIVGIK